MGYLAGSRFDVDAVQEEHKKKHQTHQTYEIALENQSETDTETHAG